MFAIAGAGLPSVYLRLLPLGAGAGYALTMANTFASHLKNLLATPRCDSVDSAVPERADKRAPLASPTGLDRVPSPKTSRPQVTYASAVLMMAVGSCVGTAHAASDGSIATGGMASSGKVGISMSIPERIDVTGLRSIAFSADASEGEVSGCISGHGSGQYHLSALNQQSLPYELSFAANDEVAAPLTMGQALQQLSGAGAMGCEDGTANARLAVRLPSNAQGLKQPLTLMVAPE